MSPEVKEMFDVLYEEQDLVEAADVDGLAALQVRKRDALERLLAKGETDELETRALRTLATDNLASLQHLVVVLQGIAREMRDKQP